MQQTVIAIATKLKEMTSLVYTLLDQSKPVEAELIHTSAPQIETNSVEAKEAATRIRKDVQPYSCLRDKMYERYMNQKGFRFQNDLAKASGLTQACVNQLLIGIHSPLNHAKTDWKPSAYTIAKTLGCKPQNLWKVRPTTYTKPASAAVLREQTIAEIVAGYRTSENSVKGTRLKEELESKGHTDVQVWWKYSNTPSALLGESGGYIATSKQIARKTPVLRIGSTFMEAFTNIQNDAVRA